jgi:hypothetical protein
MANDNSAKTKMVPPKTLKISSEAYVVFEGRAPGVYSNVHEVMNQTSNFPLAWYRPYATLDDAYDAYEIWKKRQNLTMKELIEGPIQAPKMKASRRKHLRPLVYWLANKHKHHSNKTLQAIVKMAKQLSPNNKLTIQLLEKAIQKYDPPPWLE